MIPLLFALSTAQGIHDSLAIAAGDDVALVLWDEQASIGGQRKVAGAIVDHAGYSGRNIAKLVDGGGEPDAISAAWTGKAWTVAICNDAWGPDNRDRMLVWGELTPDGTFTRQGEERFGPTGGAFHCSNVQVKDGVPYLYVATHDEHCTARRVELGAYASLGPSRPLCNVWGGIDDVIVGIDERDRPAMYARGELHRTAVTPEVGFGSSFLVTREQATLRSWNAPFKSPPRTQRLPGKPIDPFGPAQLTVAGEAVVIAQFQKDQLVVATFDKRGLVWNASLTAGDAAIAACTPVSTYVICAWADDTGVRARSLVRD